MQYFDVLTWPFQSPHPNLIKYMWVLVKQQLDEYSILAKIMLQLWEHLQASFNSITIE